MKSSVSLPNPTYELQSILASKEIPVRKQYINISNISTMFASECFSVTWQTGWRKVSAWVSPHCQLSLFLVAF